MLTEHPKLQTDGLGKRLPPANGVCRCPRRGREPGDTLRARRSGRLCPVPPAPPASSPGSASAFARRRVPGTVCGRDAGRAGRSDHQQTQKQAQPETRRVSQRGRVSRIYTPLLADVNLSQRHNGLPGKGETRAGLCSAPRRRAAAAPRGVHGERGRGARGKGCEGTGTYGDGDRTTSHPGVPSASQRGDKVCAHQETARDVATIRRSGDFPHVLTYRKTSYIQAENLPRAASSSESPSESCLMYCSLPRLMLLQIPPGLPLLFCIIFTLLFCSTSLIRSATSSNVFPRERGSMHVREEFLIRLCRKGGISSDNF